ncbi:AaceriAFR432Wp [[Ashbya] aceris (nom. inval.)]|nr:AaceriAFR432Wp [[Ashbya] aceris (nom. inval.)]
MKKKERVRDGLYSYVSLSKDYGLLITLIITTIAWAAVPAAVAVLTGRVFEVVQLLQQQEYSTTAEFIHELDLRTVALILVGFGQLPVQWVAITSWMLLGERQVLRMRRSLLFSYLEKPMQWYDKIDDINGLFTITNRCVEEARVSCAESSGVLFQSIITILILAVTAFKFCAKLTVVTLAGAPVLAIFTLIFSKYVQKYATLENEQTSNASSTLSWALNSATMVKLFGTQDLELQKFNTAVGLSKRYFIRTLICSSINQAIMRFISLMMFVQAFWYGSILIQRNEVETKAVITVFYACIVICGSINSMLSKIVLLQKGVVACRRVAQTIKTEPEGRPNQYAFPYEVGHIIALEDLPSEIVFDQVSFNYPARPDSKALDGVSLTFRSNQITFIVGKSGSGKSTLSNLLLKFYSDYEGIVTVNATNLRGIDRSWLLQNITLVEQSCTLFNGTLFENITLSAKPVNKTGSAVKRACQMALLEKLIFDLPEGLHTKVGSGGISLSGGQQQRIALARAILRDAPVLILDEAISALDIIHRDLLMEVIRSWRADKTTIILTHELSHVLDDDYLYMMEHGRVVEQGYKSNLMANPDSRFRALNRLQNSEKVKDGDEKTFCVEKSEHEDDVASSTSAADAGFDEIGSRIFSARLSALFKDGIPQDNTLYSSPRRARRRRVAQSASIELKDFDLEVQEEQTETPPVLLSIRTLMLKMFARVKTLPLTAGIISAVLCGIANPAFSYAFSKLLDGLIYNPFSPVKPSYLLRWSLIVIGIAISDSALTFLQLFLLGLVSEQCIRLLRGKVMQLVLKQDLHWISQNKSSEITTLAMNDLRDLRNVTSIFLSSLTTLIVLSSIGIIWALAVGWKLTLVCLSLLPLFAGVMAIYGRFVQKAELQYKTAVSQLENLLSEIVRGVKTIKCLQLEPYFQGRYGTLEKYLKTQMRRRAIICGSGLAITSSLVILLQAILFYYGIRLVVTLEYKSDQLFQTFTLILFTIMSSVGLLAVLPASSRGQRAGTFVFGMLEAPLPETESYSENLRETPAKRFSREPLVVARALSFAYPAATSVQVYKNLNLRIMPGVKVGLVGESGSGKSTLFYLLCGLYPVKPRSLFVDGTDICNWDLAALRRGIAVVEQKPRFFNGTIRENLVYGLEGTVTDNEIYEVLTEVRIINFVRSLPEGLDARIDTDTVSGGQLQRLSIVRALLRKPSLLILDECTSALDAANANAIANIVRNSLHDITVIVITHSRQMMQMCDRILVLKNGAVVEDGSFDDLFRARGELHRMVTTTAA